MRKLVSVTLIALALTSCSSYGPPGAFPKQAGEFKLVEGPKDIPGHKQRVAIYEARDGARVSHMISEEPADEAAAKAEVEFNAKYGVSTFEQGPKTDKSSKQVGGRVAHLSDVVPGQERQTIIYWNNGRWVCNVVSTNRQKALELVSSLPY